MTTTTTTPRAAALPGPRRSTANRARSLSVRAVTSACVQE